ncbi:MAG TPA: hypothetical protein VHZ54_17410 [Solirubrobacterales bacterium]|jgi:hypothetical protein|nr:hypothetical protein [Solirubrobacterales bacterium]
MGHDQDQQPTGLRTVATMLVTAIAMLTSIAGATGAMAASPGHRVRAHHATPAPRLVVTSKPAAAEEATVAKLTGRVAGALTAPLARYRVVLQSDAKGKFATVASKRLQGRGFTLPLNVPSRPGTVALRLQLRLGDARVGAPKAWKLAIRARPAVPATPAPASPTPVPAAKTLVLSPSTVLAVPAPGTKGTLRLTAAGEVNPGDVIAIGSGPNSPDGFLGRALSVTPIGAELIVETEPAELPDALPEGEFDKELEVAEVGGTNPAPTAATHAAITQRVDSTVECSAGTEVKVTGNVKIHPKVEIGGSWGLFSGLHAKFIAKIKASSELEASAEAAASCSVGPQTLFERTLDAIEFTVGPIPVVVVPVLSATISAEGDVEASVSTEVHGSIDAEAGLKYDHGDIHTVSNFEKDFGWTPPTPAGGARLEARVSPTFDLLIYGIGGPSATFNAGLAVEATTDPTPSWTLTAPVSLTATLSIPVLDISTGNYTVYANTFPLAEG